MALLSSLKQTIQNRSFDPKAINFRDPPVMLGMAMGVCVLVSAVVSYHLGDISLKGVTQPETNPSQKLIDRPGDAAKTSEGDQKMVKFEPVDLKKVSKDTRVYIQNQLKKQNPSKSNPAQAGKTAEDKASSTKSEAATPQPEKKP